MKLRIDHSRQARDTCGSGVGIPIRQPGALMASNEGGSGSGGGVVCKVGGYTTVVDTAASCAAIGGTVVPPKKDGKVCGGCGVAMAAMAKSLGWGLGDPVTTARSF